MKFCFSCSNCFPSAQQTVVDRTLQGDQTHQDFRVFTYIELKIATQNFRSSNKIGEGGFGPVYKGQLKDGTLVAVKVLSVEKQSIRGEREFISEISALSNIKHENLIKFQGCCVDGAERLLVYDYMENNSLSQTLLEYAISGHLTRKSDVYSFGVLLLEIITGRSAVDFDLELGEHFLVEKAWQMYITNNLVSLVDPILNGNFPEDEAVLFLKVGLLCVQETMSRRPRMSTTIKMLTNEIDIKDTEITRPALVENFMDVKVGGKRSTDIFTKGSTSY
ncbi:Serine-threonine/tyrosine-protein kinase, catalytic domain [Dillenia turbinata]|uniref:Serine-threonine/tyrosine-protein kinase, catalytic domain n=1 Tax=Dillenia turbinata TaxID=194707 RepID=A0AAN8W7I0_9MAGN